ncbi:MAG: hypothetical protein U9Q38_05650 [Thermodesulfobacteriota bacterium]|nr:hypothetical protein [Thermodesulfobacteriota bacterium]
MQNSDSEFITHHSSFSEAKLEQAVIDLFEAEGYMHLTGEQIHKQMPVALQLNWLKNLLKANLKNIRPGNAKLRPTQQMRNWTEPSNVSWVRMKAEG